MTTTPLSTGYHTLAPSDSRESLQGKVERPGWSRGSLLDSTTVTARQEWNRHRRRGRCFQSCLSGLKMPGTYRLVTLTSSLEAVAAGKNIQESFRALLGRMRRRNLCSGYVKVAEFTKAGRPHLHILMRGAYIPQWWLSEVWNRIHMSPIVDVRAVRGRAGAAGELAKYLSKDSKARLACSWDWVWKGFRGDWKLIVKWSSWRNYDLREIVERWDMLLVLYGHRPAREGPYLKGV